MHKFIKLQLLIIICLFSFVAFAQNVGISENGDTPHPSAMLDIKSANKGILIPRTDTSTVTNPAMGLMIFQNSDKAFYFHNGSSWQILGTVTNQLEDLDHDTKIDLEKNPDEDIIRFTTGGYEIARLDSNRLDIDGPGHSIYIGADAGLNDDAGENYNIAIGFEAAKEQINGFGNVNIGANSGMFNQNGDNSTNIGASAGYKNRASGNTMIGRRAGFENQTGANNTIIGNHAGRNNTGSRNIFLGNDAGRDFTGNDNLVIDNSDTDTPLIQGNFSTDVLNVNGKIGISNPNPIAAIDIIDSENRAQIKLRASTYDGFSISKKAYAEVVMQGDTITDEGYIMGVTNNRYLNTSLSYDTSRILSIRHLDEVGVESTKLSISPNAITAHGDNDLNVFSDATFYQDIALSSINGGAGIVYADQSRQSSAAGTIINSSILQARDTATKGFKFPQGSDTLAVPAEKATVFYDSLGNQFLYHDGNNWNSFNEDEDWTQTNNGYVNLNDRFILGSLLPLSAATLSVTSPETSSAYFLNNGNEITTFNTTAVHAYNANESTGKKYGLYGYSDPQGTGTKIGTYGASRDNVGAPHYGGYFQTFGLNGTGMFCKGDGLALEAEGDVYLRDNLGIRVNTPAFFAHIHNPTSILSTMGFTNYQTGKLSKDGFQVGLQNTGHGMLWHKELTGEIRFGTKDLQRMVIDEEGQVGIGTGSVIDSKLHIHKASGNDIPAKIRFTDNITGVGSAVTVAGFEVGLGVNQDGIILHTDPKDVIFYTDNVTETMRVEADGDLLVGNANETQQIRMNNGSIRLINLGNGDSDQGFEWGETGSTDFAFVYDGVGTTTNKRLHIREYFGASSDLFTFVGNGNMGVGVTNPTFRLQLNANSAAKPISSAWVVASDARLKEDLGLFEDGLSTILQINPKRFRYNGRMNMPTDEIAIGTMAQELMKVAPYMVKEIELNSENGQSGNFLAVDYGAMDFVLVNSIKELNAKIESQETIIQKLEERLNSLELAMVNAREN